MFQARNCPSLVLTWAMLLQSIPTLLLSRFLVRIPDAIVTFHFFLVNLVLQHSAGSGLNSRKIWNFAKVILKEILANRESRSIFGFLVLNLSFMFVEILYGYWTNSLVPFSILSPIHFTLIRQIYQILGTDIGWLPYAF